MSDLLELISKRKSVRNYNGQLISDDVLKNILEAGRLAPSWMNVQCWKFILIKSQENKDILSELSIGQQQVKNAAALIVCIADINAWNDAGISNIKNQALNPALQGENGLLLRSMEQVIYPISYMMLEAESLGVSSCIIGAFGNDVSGILPDIHEKVKTRLGLNNNHIISTIIALGYEKEPKTTPQKTRKLFDDIVSLEKLGEKF